MFNNGVKDKELLALLATLAGFLALFGAKMVLSDAWAEQWITLGQGVDLACFGGVVLFAKRVGTTPGRHRK